MRITSRVDVRSTAYADNRAAMLDALDEIGALTAQVVRGGGSGRPGQGRPLGRQAALARQAAPARAHRAAARPRLALPRALAAGRLGHRRPAGRRHGHRHRPHPRRRVRHQRQRPDGQGRGAGADERGQGTARDGDRAGQPASAGLAHRVGRRRPAQAGRDLRARRGVVQEPHPALRRRHPDDHARVRVVDRGRCLRARDERLRRAAEGRGARLPRRPAAGEDGDRRGRRRGVARRRRDARARERAGRLPRRRRARRPAHRPRHRRPPQLAPAGPGARGRRPRAAGVRPGGAARHRFRRRACALRGARGDRARGRRQRVRGVQAALRHHAGDRLGAPRRLSGRHPGQQRDPVQRGGREGRAVHPAVRAPRRADPVRAEHHRLHGRHALRAGRHHQGRRQAHQRGVQLHGAAPHAHGRRVLRRRATTA